MEDIVTLICYGLVIIAVLYVIMAVLPYLLVFLALCGAWYLFQEYNKER
jgi:hypothetical protein